MVTSPVENLFVLSVEAKQNVLVILNFLALFYLNLKKEPTPWAMVTRQLTNSDLFRLNLVHSIESPRELTDMGVFGPLK